MNRRLMFFAVSLLLLTAFLTVNAQKPLPGAELIEQLLSLPALPPPNPYDRPPRSDDFFDPMKPPPDDAPIGDLLEYWAVQSKANPKYQFAVTPSPASARRILEAVSKNPAEITKYLTALRENPEAIDAVKQIYDKAAGEDDEDDYLKGALRSWLVRNSPYFGNELAAVAASAQDEREYLTNQDEVLALMRTNWELAEPLLGRFYSNSSQPVTQTLARWAFYEHAIRTGDQLGISRWREELKSVVEDKSAPMGARDLAMDALVEAGDFEGRDEWYVTMLEDETFLNVIIDGRPFTGLTTIMNHSPAGKYDDRMIELVRTTSNRTVRSAALRNLANSGGLEREDAVKASLRWLTDPDWAKNVRESRLAIARSLQTIRLPEAGPALLAYLAELRAIKAKSSKDPAKTAGLTYFQNLSIANVGAALGNQRDPRAVPALREVLAELPEQHREGIVKALFDCGGFETTELVEAIEGRARTNADETTGGRTPKRPAQVFPDENPPDAEAELLAPSVRTDRFVSGALSDSNGRFTPYEEDAVTPVDMAKVRSQLEDLLDAPFEPSDELLRTAVKRAEALNRTEPAVAAEIRAIFGKWTGRAVNHFLIRDAATGMAGVTETLSLLTRRKELRENQRADLGELHDGVPAGAGIAACIVEQDAAYDAILNGGNETAKAAMLACARLIRAKLPVTNVAALIPSKNKLLSVAAQKYLIAEDSPEARKIIFETYPNKAIVLGARFAFDDSGGFDPELLALFRSVQYWPPGAREDSELPSERFDAVLKKLRAEVLGDETLVGVYAFEDNVIRMYRDRTVFSWTDDPARYRYRTLEPEEVDRIQAFVTEQKLSELPPFLSGCDGWCPGSEFLMLGKAGGQRVFVGTPSSAPFVAGLETILSEFRSKPARIRYVAQDAVKGLEVVFDDDAKSALTVWHQNGELRALLVDQAERKAATKELARASRNAFNNSNETQKNQEEFKAKIASLATRGIEWFRFENGALGGKSDRPEGLKIPLGAIEEFDFNASEQWKWKAATLSIRVDQDGISKVVNGVATPVIKGEYGSALVSGDGRWIVATRSATGGEMTKGEYGIRLVKIDTVTGKEMTLPYDDTRGKLPVVYFAPNGKFLIARSYFAAEGTSDASIVGLAYANRKVTDFAWLEPKTGVVTPVMQEVRPIADQSFRPLQEVFGRAGEYWAAITDEKKERAEIGIYDSKSMQFRALIILPKIVLSSMMIWVDEPAKLCYFTYGGQVLSVPVNW